MPGLVSMADVRAHLNLDPSDVSHDVELQGFIDAMGPVISYMTGPVVPTTFTNESHNGGGPHIMLFNPPIISVQSVTEYAGNITYTLSQQQPGATVDNYGFSIDSFASGMLTRRGVAGVPLPFYGFDGGVIVSYTAGLASIPPDIRMAALEDLRGLYQQSQQGGRPAFGGGAEDDSWSSGPLDLFPRLAMLLVGRRRTQSIA